MALAGGWSPGDRVLCGGMPGMVVGRPARAACSHISVAVHYDDGRVVDERVLRLAPAAVAAAEGGRSDERRDGERAARPFSGSRILEDDRMRTGEPARSRRSIGASGGLEWDGPPAVTSFRGSEIHDGGGNYNTLLKAHSSGGVRSPDRERDRDLWSAPEYAEPLSPEGTQRSILRKSASNTSSPRKAASVEFNDDASFHTPPQQSSASGVGVQEAWGERASDTSHGMDRGSYASRSRDNHFDGQPQRMGAQLQDSPGYRRSSGGSGSMRSSRGLDTRQVRRPPPAMHERNFGDSSSQRQLPPSTPSSIGPAPISPRASEAETIIRQKIRRNWSSLRGAFRALDRSNNGYVSRADFKQAMHDIFLPNGFFNEEDIEEVSELFGLHRQGNLSYDEFASIVDQKQERPTERTGRHVTEIDCALKALKMSVEMRFSSIRDAFRAMDKNRKTSLTREEFVDGVRSHGIRLTFEQMEDLRLRFDPEGTGEIGFSRFAKVLSQVSDQGKLSRQTYLG